MAERRFGFSVRREEDWGDCDEPGRVGWAVELPHQCDAWAINREDSYSPTTSREEAVAALVAFLNEGALALEHLERGEEFNPWGQGPTDAA